MTILNLTAWWEGLSTFATIYWIIALPASLIFVIQIVMTFIGADVDSDGMDALGDADLSVEADAGIGFQLISLKNFIGFFTIFGWVGLACIDAELPTYATIIISTISGFLMMVLMASIYYFMGKLTESGNLNLKNADGKTGTVYLKIPAKRSGMGKVQIQLQGYQTLDAMTDDEEDIPTGGIVIITGVYNNDILLVKKA